MKSTSHRRVERKPEALSRQEAWASLTTKEQLKALDLRLGKGVGAARQRLRLKGIQAATAPAEVHAPEAVEEVAPSPKKKAKERKNSKS